MVIQQLKNMGKMGLSFCVFHNIVGVLNFSLLRYLVVRYFPTLMQDMVPCILVTFEKEQIVVWRGKDYKPVEDGYFLPDRESFDDMDGSSSDGSLVCGEEGCDSVGWHLGPTGLLLW